MRVRLTAIVGLLVLGLTVPTAAQESTPPSTSLSERCQVNAPDEVTLTTCLEVVNAVLAPAGEDVRLVTVTTPEDFMAGMADVIPEQYMIDSGTFQTSEASTERTKPATKKQRREGAKRELEIVRRFADETRAYLMSVTPDPCYENMYAAGWGLATALQQWADKALKQPEILLDNAYNQYVESPQAISCGEPAVAE